MAYEKQILDQAFDLVDMIYQAPAAPDAGWHEVIRGFGDLFPGSRTVLGTYKGGRLHAARSATDLTDDVISAYGNHFVQINPVVPPLIDKPANTYFDAFDFVERGDFRRSEIYNDFWKPNGDLFNNVGVILENAEGYFSTFCTHYPENARTESWTVAPGYLIKRLLPHLRRALQQQALLERQKLHSATLEQALDALDEAAFLVDDSGWVIDRNEAAEDLLFLGDVVRLTPDGVLRFADGGADRFARQAVLDSGTPEAFEAGRDPADAFHFRTADRVYRLSIIRAVQRSPSIACVPVVPGRLMLVCLRELTRERGLCTEPIRQLYNITTAEMALIVALFDGCSLAEHASNRGISVETVRNQLKSVFRKTDASSQSDLMRLLGGFRA